MRMQGCRQCEGLTGGDCGMHGPLTIPYEINVPTLVSGVNLDAHLADLAKWKAVAAELNKGLHLTHVPQGFIACGVSGCALCAALRAYRELAK